MMRPPPPKKPRTTIGITRFFVASPVHYPPIELADEGNTDEGKCAASNSTHILGIYVLSILVVHFIMAISISRMATLVPLGCRSVTPPLDRTDGSRRGIFTMCINCISRAGTSIEAFDTESITDLRLTNASLDKDQLDLLLLGKSSSVISRHAMTTRSRHLQTARMKR